MRLLVEAANASIGIEGDRLVSVDGRFDLVLPFPSCVLVPGLINAHDHLHRNHYGRLGTPPYPNAYEWGRDIHARQSVRIARGRSVPRRLALLRGAWKNLLAGVTTAVHHDRWELEFERGFPLRVPRLRWAHAPGLEPDVATVAAGTGPFAIHLAEGVDEGAAAEFRLIEDLGLLNPDLLAVHLVGLDRDGVERFRSSGAAVIWCPSSNEFLFGRTAPPELLAPGVDVLLGSDSLLTGAGTLLDEIRIARELGHLTDERLLDSVGAVAARRLGLPAPSLTPGSRADVVLFRRPILEADVSDVAMVVAGGIIRVLDPAWVPALDGRAGEGRVREIDGLKRWLNQTPTVPRRSLQPRRL